MSEVAEEGGKNYANNASTVLVGFGPLYGQDVMDDQDYDDITAEVHAEASEIACEKQRE